MAVQGRKAVSDGPQSSGSEPRMGASADRPPQDQGRHPDLRDKVSEAGREVASHSMQAVSDRTRSTTESYKQDISKGLHSLAEGLRDTRDKLRDDGIDRSISSSGSRYLATAANKVDDLSAYIERKDLTDLLRDFRGFARQHPTAFVGGAFALGFAISRVMRSGTGSSGPRSHDRVARI